MRITLNGVFTASVSTISVSIAASIAVIVSKALQLSSYKKAAVLGIVTCGVGVKVKPALFKLSRYFISNPTDPYLKWKCFIFGTLTSAVTNFLSYKAFTGRWIPIGNSRVGLGILSLTIGYLFTYAMKPYFIARFRRDFVFRQYYSKSVLHLIEKDDAFSLCREFNSSSKFLNHYFERSDVSSDEVGDQLNHISVSKMSDEAKKKLVVSLSSMDLDGFLGFISNPSFNNLREILLLCPERILPCLQLICHDSREATYFDSYIAIGCLDILYQRGEITSDLTPLIVVFFRQRWRGENYLKTQLTLINEFGMREDISSIHLKRRLREVYAYKFKEGDSQSRIELSSPLIEKIFSEDNIEQFDENQRRVFLDLLVDYPAKQSQILKRFPLGADYVYHSDNEIYDRKRFYYPKLHPDIVADLLMKQNPSVWDLVFCARYHEEGKLKLSNMSVEELLPLALIHECKGEFGRDRDECWYNYRCWFHSPLKIAYDVLSAEKKELFKTLCGSSWKYSHVNKFLKNEKGPDSSSNISFSLEDIKPGGFKLYHRLLIPHIDSDRPPPIESVEKLLTMPNWYYSTKVVSADLPNPFDLLPKDVFNQICQRLHPLDRARMGAVSRGLFHRICGPKGESIWKMEGSIGSVRRVFELYEEMKWLGLSDPPHHLRDKRLTLFPPYYSKYDQTARVLALAWPMHYWPKENRFNFLH